MSTATAENNNFPTYRCYKVRIVVVYVTSLAPASISTAVVTSPKLTKIHKSLILN
jgi:hypothetical protein